MIIHIVVTIIVFPGVILYKNAIVATDNIDINNNVFILYN